MNYILNFEKSKYLNAALNTKIVLFDSSMEELIKDCQTLKPVKIITQF